eukprot:CAMPEP_0185739066 /NCGR_PEP_ID=MMETSP1171-20130828/34523_1 /TAXON_ID=374046 /ORGANISM="Helicotheca tamensis, Strain CCMP826" /LENGTH=396 /DNA_ID=CAMNT_0028410507 /DNA_START=54 /DNA_END=1244 /DNA_ORIENTATION=-
MTSESTNNDIVVEEEQETNDDDGWGITSALSSWGFPTAVTGEEETTDDTAAATTGTTSALSSWGFTTTTEETTTATEDNTAAIDITTSEGLVVGEQQEEEPGTVGEDVLAGLEDAATAVEDAATSAASFISGSMTAFFGGTEDNNDDAGTTNATKTKEEPPFTSTENNNTSAMEIAESMTSMPLTLMSSAATTLGISTNLNPSEWITDLEKQSLSKDPHTKLREFLDAYLQIFPKASYEEWIEECLVNIEGWEKEEAVVDESFYAEDSVHREVWNERNSLDGIDLEGVDIEDEDEGGEVVNSFEEEEEEGGDGKGETTKKSPKNKRKGRQYVPARATKQQQQQHEEEDDDEIVFVSEADGDGNFDTPKKGDVGKANLDTSKGGGDDDDDDLHDLVN